MEAKLWKRRRFETLDELKDALTIVWEEFPQTHIDKAINSFRKRYNLIVKNEGGKIEKFTT